MCLKARILFDYLSVTLKQLPQALNMHAFDGRVVKLFSTVKSQIVRGKPSLSCMLIGSVIFQRHIANCVPTDRSTASDDANRASLTKLNSDNKPGCGARTPPLS